MDLYLGQYSACVRGREQTKINKKIKMQTFWGKYEPT